MTTKTWIIFAAIIVVLFGGLVLWSQKDKIDVSKVDTNAILPTSKQSGNIGDHVFGNKDAKVVLVEYGDFQCPGCGSTHPFVRTISEKYKDDMAFVFRNFPLSTIHPNARAAAAAVETAGLMGKYWEMHNMVYDSQSEWSEADATERTDFFTRYAGQVGLNKDAFTKKLGTNSSQVNMKINFDQALGHKLGTTGTPTFYLNGKKLSDDSFSSEDSFTKVIEKALKDAGVKIKD